jgi:hypothetical protein
MNVAVRFTNKEELKAIPILMRHSPGMILPGKIYVLSTGAVAALRDAGVRFTQLTSATAPPSLEQPVAGVRI